jgi:hypothetical protein
MENQFLVRWLLVFSCVAFLLAACAAGTQTSETEGVIEIPSDRKAVHPGDPRSTAYWTVWNTCAPENRATQAAANGGRKEGWTLMDDLLKDPGILMGKMQVETCQQGLNLLQSRNLQGIEMNNDAAYALAAQLLAAQLNLAAGSEYCPASDQAVSQAQLLLLELNFDGTGGYLGPPKAGKNIEAANKLTEQLASYNSGVLCGP